MTKIATNELHGVVGREKVKGRGVRKRGSPRLTSAAARIRKLSLAIWGSRQPVEIIGRSSQIAKLLQRVEKIARYQEPVLILGESGVGKESFAKALYILGPRTKKPFVSANCPRYQEGNLIVSELFGHKKGAFTGAVSDRKGCFETAHGGMILLDEIADLPMTAQVMLLHALATGEFQPLGSDISRQADVRVVAATNRPLNQLVAREQFRHDLLFRLRAFQIEIPPLRERGDDWRLLLDHFLNDLERRYGEKKRFSAASLKILEEYSWPGNVRELIALTTSGYALADGTVIEPPDFADSLESEGYGAGDRLQDLLGRLGRQEGSFWELVQQPYLDRELNRRETQRLIAEGLRRSHGSYRQLLELWRIPSSQYQKFMDFLRHHRLKPGVFGDGVP